MKLATEEAPARDVRGRAVPIGSRGLTSIEAPDFNLERTLNCGQVFHACPRGQGWMILIDRLPLYIEQSGSELRVRPGFEAAARHYLALDHPLGEIYAEFPRDPFSMAALAACRGIRILRQPKWECLATFITSPMKQVAHIRQISFNLRQRFGENVRGSRLQAYPRPEYLASASEADLRACGLGFRAKSLLRTAQLFADGKADLEAMARLPTSEAREALCALPGVGRKVANCVLLFAFERLDSVPVDIWMARILRNLRGKKSSLLELERFSSRRFGAYAGYVQQYLFHYARMTRTLPAR